VKSGDVGISGSLYPQLDEELVKVQRAAAVGVEGFEERLALVRAHLEAVVGYALAELGELDLARPVVVEDQEGPEL